MNDCVQSLTARLCHHQKAKKKKKTQLNASCDLNIKETIPSMSAPLSALVLALFYYLTLAFFVVAFFDDVIKAIHHQCNKRKH
jgi:hypothetical protein